MGGAEVATFRDELDLCDPIPVHTTHYFCVISKHLPFCVAKQHHMHSEDESNAGSCAIKSSKHTAGPRLLK